MNIPWYLFALSLVVSFFLGSIAGLLSFLKIEDYLEVFKEVDNIRHKIQALGRLTETQEFLVSMPIKDTRTKKLIQKNQIFLGKMVEEHNLEELMDGNQLHE